MTENEKLILIQSKLDAWPDCEVTIKKAYGQITDVFATEHLHWGIERKGERRQNLVVLTGIQTTPIL